MFDTILGSLVSAAIVILLALFAYILKISRKVEKNEVEINGLGKRVDENLKKIEDQLYLLRTEETRRIWDALYKQEKSIAILQTQIEPDRKLTLEYPEISRQLKHISKIMTDSSQRIDDLWREIRGLQSNINNIYELARKNKEE